MPTLDNLRENIASGTCQELGFLQLLITGLAQYGPVSVEFLPVEALYLLGSTPRY